MKIDIGNNLRFAKSVPIIVANLLKAAQHWNGWSQVSRERVLGLVGDLRRSKSIEEAARRVVEFITPMVPETLSQSLSGVIDDLARPTTQLPGMKLSLGTAKDCARSDDSTLESNSFNLSLVSRLELKNSSVMRGNNWNNTLVRTIAVSQSDFNENNASMAFLENLDLNEAKVAGNAVALGILRKLTVRTADFTDNKLAKATLNDVSVIESRLHRLKMAGTKMNTVRFESCNLEGLSFVGCRFDNVTFRNVCIDGANEKPLVGLHAENLVIADCDSLEAFLNAVKGAPAAAPEHSPEPARAEHPPAPEAPVPEAPAMEATEEPRRDRRPQGHRQPQSGAKPAAGEGQRREGRPNDGQRREGRPHDGQRREGKPNPQRDERRHPQQPRRSNTES